MTQIRSSDEASRLYKQLTDQISEENAAEIRRTYKQLLRNGESLGAIVGAAISSIRQAQDGRGRGGSVGCGSASNEVSEAGRVPVEFPQDPSEAALRQAPVVDAYIDRPRRIAELQGAGGDDRPFDALSARRRVQTEPTQVASEVEAHGPAAAANRVGDTKIQQEPHSEITDGPRLNSPSEVRRYPKLRSYPRLTTSPPSAASRAILVLATLLVAAACVSLLLRMHRPADEDLAAPPHPAAVSPPTPAIAADASGLSGVASATLSGEAAALGLDKRPTVTPSTAPPTATAAGIVATSVVGSTEMRTSPVEVAPLLERGDALLATGDYTSARLFYEAAADAGDANAALRLGATFDPIFIDRANLRGVHADMERAAFWYRRARDLGSSDAENLLKYLAPAKP